MNLFSDHRETTLRYGRHVNDLRCLLVFHGLPCGSVGSFEALGAKLLESGAFRTDLSGSARSIRKIEAGSLSGEEMLTVIALASGGEELVGGPVGSAGVAKTAEMLRLFLAGIGGWRETIGVGLLDDAVHPGESRPNRTNESSPTAGLGEVLASASPAASSAATETTLNREQIQGHLELEISELKVYLDDLDRRIGRIEPRLEHFPQVVAMSAELIQRPGEDPAGDKNIEAGQRGSISPSLSAETKAALVRRAEVWRDGLIAKGIATGGREVSQAHSGEKSTGAGWEEVRRQEPASEETEVVADENATRRSDLPASLTNADAVTSEPGALESELRDETIVAGRRQGDFPMNAKQGESRKERVGRLLGVAAVLLAIAGLFGLPAFFRSPQDPIESTGPQRVRNDRIVSSTPAARDKGLQEQGQGQTQTYRTQPIEPTADTGTVSGNERAAREHLATKPITLAKAGTSKKEARSQERKVRSPEKQRGVVARSAPVLDSRIADSRTPEGRIADGRIADGGGRISSREPGPRLPAGDRLATAGGTPLIVDSSGMDRKLISARAPVYPPEAIRQHMEGRVVLNAFIAKDGTVRRMDVLEGSKVFTKSALAAVSWRHYKPYLVGGRPVEVQTQITVNYPGTEKKIRAPL